MISIDDLATFCKRRGFIYPSSEIYGGFSGFWDFGPLGVELFNNIKQNWWKYFVNTRKNMIGIDASIISHPKTWIASGHVTSFKDIAVVCKKCKKATKIDKSELEKVKCECGGEYESQGEFNLLFKTKVGALDSQDAYLRGETAQGMFLDFKQIVNTTRVKLPFGISQIGKCFRNEIAPRDFLFRSREFTIGEFEFFIHPEENRCDLLDKKHLDVEFIFLNAETQIKGKNEFKKITIEKMLKENRLEEWHAYWLAEQILWFKELGLNIDKLKIREHTKDELSHYSSATFDIDFEYPFGSKEVAGNANRGQYDLKQHIKESKEKLEIYDEETKKSVIPRVIEPTFGMERVFLAIIADAYNYDKKRENIVLHLNPKLAPIKVAIFPLLSNKKELTKLSQKVYDDLKEDFVCNYDESGSIGKRYARNDEVGTPYCITIDFDSIKKKDITIRDRDSTKQIRVKIKDLKNVLERLFNQEIKFEKAGKTINTRVK
ncbi:MAG: glycine--tRNA ligase [Candidatus Woesearchaeota archaeon]|nr:glycine--tRNA ligase [Candidatus Woesearchaeota archaeon]